MAEELKMQSYDANEDGVIDLGEITDNEVVNGSLDTVENSNYYEFTATQDGYLTITINADSNAVYEFHVMSANDEYWNSVQNWGDKDWKSTTLYVTEGNTYSIDLWGLGSRDENSDVPMGEYSFTFDYSNSVPEDRKEGDGITTITFEEYNYDYNLCFGREIEGLTLHDGDDDIFTFTLADDAENIYIHTECGDWDAEARFTIYDAYYREIDDSTDGVFEMDNLAKGTYYIKVSSDSPVADYNIRVGGVYGDSIEADDYECNDDMDSSTTIVLENGSLNGGLNGLTIHRSYDVDWFTFTLTEDAISISIETWSNIQGDTELYIYNAAGEQLAYNDNYEDYYVNNVDAYIALTNLTAGTYYIKVTGKDKFAEDYNIWVNGEYGEISQPDPDDPGIGGEPDPDDPVEDKGFIFSETGDSFTIPALDGDDYDGVDYKFTLKEDGALDFSVADSTAEGYFEISLSGTGDWFIFDGSVSDVTLRAGEYEIYANNTSDITVSFEAIEELLEPDVYEGDNYDLGAVADGTVIKANIDVTVDVDWYEFTAAQTGYLTITIDADSDGIYNFYVTGEGDYVDGEGNECRQYVYNYPDADFNSTTLYVTEGSAYYINSLHGRATTDDSSCAPMGEYTLTFNYSNSIPADRKEGTSGNDQKSSATAIEFDEYGLEYGKVYCTIEGLTIHNTDDVDWFSFTLTNDAEWVDIYTWHVQSADTDLTIYNASGEQITYNDNCYEDDEYTDTSANIVMRDLTAGTYYVKVTGKGGLVADYTLSIEGQYGEISQPDPDDPSIGGDPDPDYPENPSLPDWFASAEKLEYDEYYYKKFDTFYFNIEPEEYQGDYKFNLTQECFVGFVFVSEGAEGSILLYNSKGEEIELAADYTKLSAGTYYVSVEGDRGGIEAVKTVDRFESNNSFGAAAEMEALGSGSYFEYNAQNVAFASAKDVDYYKFTLKEDATKIWVGDRADYYGLPVEFSIYSGDVLIGEAEWDEEFSMYSYYKEEGLAAGTYYLKVEGGNEGIYGIGVTGYYAELKSAVAGTQMAITVEDPVVAIQVAEQDLAIPVQESVSIYAPRANVAFEVTSENNPDLAPVTGEAEAIVDAPESVLVMGNDDGMTDLFVASATDVWSSNYEARNVGFGNPNYNCSWEGTGETVNLGGKNKITDFFFSGNDRNILVLTDDANGDALFVDDIYSATPRAALDNQSRIQYIDEIFAGAGDDIIDMTSQRFGEYEKNVETVVHGGNGNDVIWGFGQYWNDSGEYFGDAGDDRIVASGLIVGGLGDDTLQAYGDTVLAFGKNDGNDIVEWHGGASITLLLDATADEVEIWDYLGDITIYKFANCEIVVRWCTVDKVVYAASEENYEDYKYLFEGKSSDTNYLA